ncbi:MAG: NACHT domain-containing NTPase [Coleofasciculus sp. B1-GNL1-01]|uniref:NACHT domain-containing protein n=1 Tax=Coleofasciculus sp. B1-GNL1-01 TaxID=3068484 RepID=UPI0032FAE013
MARRSLKASTEGIQKAKQAFLRKGWTQEYLAGEVGLETRQPIWKFFKGKPVDHHVFIEICFRLDLDLDEIAALPSMANPHPKPNVQTIDNDINTLVNQVRQKHHDKLHHQCGTLRLLDITRPIDLDELYVDVNILEEISSQRWLDLNDLQGDKSKDFDRLGLGNVRLEGLAGLKAVERYGKLMVLGKPGAGKTTFLQYLAIQCNTGKFKPEQVPIFIRLKNFAEDACCENNGNLFNYITQEFERCQVTAPELETVLNQGRALLLLDGLDEVPDTWSDAVIRQIRQLADHYYKNQIIITCRIAAKEYRFPGFTEVELADFKRPQIEQFVRNWFIAVARNKPASGLKKAALFLEQLESPENQPIRELATTPVLLNLSCLVFQTKTEFPKKRCDLYKQGLDLLLIRWDEARGIKRDDIYRNLSLSHKLQLLSQIAAITFEQGDYFFTESTLVHLIGDYLQQQLGDRLDLATLELDSAAVLKSIEAQHGLLVERARGIYSFSHLTFQEYFTARAVVADAETSIPQLLSHFTEKRWREVILLTAQMLPHADGMIQCLKQQIDALVVAEVEKPHKNERSPAKLSPAEPTAQTLPGLLDWVRQKSLTVTTSYKSAAVRAFYLTLALPPNHRLAGDSTLALAIDPRLAGELAGDIGLDLALTQALAVAIALTPDLVDDRLNALHLALELDYLTQDTPLSTALRQLKQQLPNCQDDKDKIQQWWRQHSQEWVAQLRSVMIDHRNIGYEWHLGALWQKRFDSYDYANRLIVDCLKSNCQLTATVRQEIETTLL